MFVGHLAVGASLARRAPSLGLGAIFAGTLLLDGVLGILTLLGVEHVQVPLVWQTHRFFTFDFPWSHGLIATLVWATLFAAVLSRGIRARFVVLFAAVASHFVLDAVVHVPELRVGPGPDPAVGFSLWMQMPIALAVEVALVVVGLALYVPTAPTRRARIGVVILLAVLTATTLAGQLAGDVAPPPAVLAITWIAQVVLIPLVAIWLERPPRSARTISREAAAP